MGKQNTATPASVSPHAAKRRPSRTPSEAEERKGSGAYSLFQLPFYIFDAHGKQLNRLGRLHLGLRLHGHQITKAVIVVADHLPDVPACPAAYRQRHQDAGKHGGSLGKIQETCRYFGELTHAFTS